MNLDLGVPQYARYVKSFFHCCFIGFIIIFGAGLYDRSREPQNLDCSESDNKYIEASGTRWKHLYRDTFGIGHITKRDNHGREQSYKNTV